MGPAMPARISLTSILAYAGLKGYNREDIEFLDEVMEGLETEYFKWWRETLPKK
jgi:hypothetical protein